MNSPSTAFVVLLGIGTVFIGLIGLVILCKILGSVCNIKKQSQPETSTAINSTVATTSTVIENRQEIIAAVSAVLAEELGTDVSALRILSFKKI